MISFFLALVLGWYFVIFSLTLLFRRHVITNAMREVISNPGSSLILAILTLIIGLLLVISHNVWVWNWPLIITLFGWLILISGILRLTCLETARRMGERFLGHPTAITIVSIVFLILGLILLFWAYLTGF